MWLWFVDSATRPVANANTDDYEMNDFELDSDGVESFLEDLDNDPGPQCNDKDIDVSDEDIDMMLTNLLKAPPGSCTTALQSQAPHSQDQLAPRLQCKRKRDAELPPELLPPQKCAPTAPTTGPLYRY